MSVDSNIDVVNFFDLPLIDCPVDKYVLIFLMANAKIKNKSMNPK